MADWTLDELRDAVRRPLGNFPDVITVDNLRVGEGDGRGSLVCDLTVRDNDGTARWQLTVEDALEDLDDKTLNTATLVVRANIEEWWHTRKSEPNVARMAQRLS